MSSPSGLFLAQDGQLTPITVPDRAPAPLGAALTCDLRQTPLESLAVGLREHARSPWCPLVVVLPDGVGATILERIRPDVCRMATLTLASEDLLPTFDALSAAVSRRGPPVQLEVVKYIRSRADERLARAVGESLEGAGAWSAALRRRLRRLDMPSPQHWANLFRLSTYLAAAASPHRRTLEQIALESDRAPRTVSGWCGRFLRLSWPDARRRLGWEWIFELALRGTETPSSIVPAPAPLRP